MRKDYVLACCLQKEFDKMKECVECRSYALSISQLQEVFELS